MVGVLPRLLGKKSFLPSPRTTPRIAARASPQRLLGGPARIARGGWPGRSLGRCGPSMAGLSVIACDPAPRACAAHRAPPDDLLQSKAAAAQGRPGERS